MSGSRVRDRSAPPRPGIPPILLCGLALWLGAAAGRECAVAFGIVVPAALILVSCLAGAACGVRALRRDGEGAVTAFAALFVALGLAASLVSIAALDHTRSELLSRSGETFRFQVVEDPAESSFGQSAVLRVVRGGGVVETPGSAALVRAYFDGDAPRLGQEFEAQASFHEPSEAGAAYYDRKGIACRADVGEAHMLAPSSFGALSALRASFVDALNALGGSGVIDAEALVLVRALVVGDRTELFAQPLYQEVKVVGLAHLVAVSGAHLVIVTGFAKVLLEALRLPQRLRVAMQLAFVFVYVVMVGFPVSCLRAAAMSVVSACALTASRRSHALSSLGVAVIVIVGIDPAAATSLSFALSVLATLGIVLFVSLFASWVPVASQRVRSWIVDPLAMTAAATLMTFPLSIAQFAQFPIVAPISNVLAAPIVSLVCGLGVAAFVSLPIPLLSTTLLHVVCGAAGIFVRAVDLLAHLPFASIPVDASLPVMAAISAGAVAALWLLWPLRVDARALGLGSAVTALCLVAAFFPRMGSELIMLDVGQGDAFVVRSRGSCVLVDTGNDPQALYEGLARHGVRRLDGVVVSHADDDHCACIADLVGVVPCKAVYLAQGMGDADSDKARELVADAQRLVGSEGVCELAVGDALTIGSFRAKVLSPDELVDDGGNADSLCLLLECPKGEGDSPWTALLCGDAEAEVLNPLVQEGSLGAVDVYKVGHHGSRAALDAELAHTLSPRVALVSVGAHNAYGHPNEDVLTLLANEGAETLCSDEVGDVVCEFGPERIEVSTMR